MWEGTSTTGFSSFNIYAWFKAEHSQTKFLIEITSFIKPDVVFGKSYRKPYCETLSRKISSKRLGFSTSIEGLHIDQA